MGLQPLYAKGSVPSLWTGLQVSCGKITLSDLPDHLNYRVIYTVYTECTNVVVGQIIQPGRQPVGEPCTIWSLVFHFQAALFLGNKTPVPIEWEAGWAP